MKHSITSLVVITALLAATSATPALARSGSVTTGNGKTYSYEGSTTKNEDGSVTNESSVTGPNGKTASRSATTTVDKSTGTVSRTVTAPNGKTRTSGGSVSGTTSAQ